MGKGKKNRHKKNKYYKALLDHPDSTFEKQQQPKEKDQNEDQGDDSLALGMSRQVLGHVYLLSLIHI